MAACCSDGCTSNREAVNPRYRKAALGRAHHHALMFVVEIVGGLKSGSVSLLADAVDFAGDAANYGISLTVLSMGLIWRARAALVKGLSMGAYGLFVLGKTAWAAMSGVPPEPFTMHRDRFAGTDRKCLGRPDALRFPQRRCQHALGLAVQPQRCHRGCGDCLRCARCPRHGNGLARPGGGADYRGARAVGRDQRRAQGTGRIASVSGEAPVAG